MNILRSRGMVKTRRLKTRGALSIWRMYTWDLEDRVSRKANSSVGAGLNGEGIGDIEEELEVGGLAGGLPELFLAFGIVIALYRQDSPQT